jgi:lantibiotic modifying enzyme
MEVLLTGSVVLRQPAYRIAAEMAARNLLKAEDWWASGTICGGPTPSFMTGTAGIGYHFLRIYDTDHVPSVLSGVFH